MNRINFKKNKVLINASNLHNGGGVQVATSFICELSQMQAIDNFHVIVSSEVAESLSELNVNTEIFTHYEIIDNYGLKAFVSHFNKQVKKYDVVFTVFGPNYLKAQAKVEVVGFAQPWILNFENPISKKMHFLKRNVLRFKFYLQWLLFLRADHYIVELEHVKNSLITIKKLNPDKVSVVYNTVSSLYTDESKWKPTYIEKKGEGISLGIVTRDYPHKNLNVLPHVAAALESKYCLDVHFYTTLNATEWANKSEFFKKHVSTVGSLLPDQCPSFYEQIDGVVFPSLLECFSATPLEAMVMNRPLFASDRGFIRDVCHEHATYFDPLNADDIALQIATYFTSDINRSTQLQNAREHALNFSSARGRAKQYFNIIQQHLKD